MFIGVVGHPISHCYFNGYILLERISKDAVATKPTSHSSFSDDVLVNSSIKSGEWRMATSDNRYISTEKLISTIVINYCLDEAIADKMEVFTPTFIGDNRNTKNIKLDNMANVYEEEIRVDCGKTLPKVNLTINDV